MREFLLLLSLLLELYVLLVIVRIIIEMVSSFSRNWRPQRWFTIIAEPVFVVTDPPLKLLRRLIPPLRMGNIGLDISVLVLFFILQILGMLLHQGARMF